MQARKYGENSIDQEKCIAIVAQYMEKQGWGLLEPAELAENIWGDVADQNLSGQVAVERLQNQAWQRYAVILHNSCCQDESHLYAQGWEELRDWLCKQVQHLSPAPDEPEVLIQETATDLHQALRKSPLESPRAFLAYTLKALQRKNIDLNRKRTAHKRGNDDELYLAEMESNSHNDDGYHWDEIKDTQDSETRAMETSLATEEIKEQLRIFFRKHLSTSLQKQVAEAHFLDGLNPSGIAQLMGKRPHEIRMVKARVVSKLRGLPPDAQRSLLDVLGEIDREAGNE
jgi:DNA-directed RNA polymerase specialized sigma24 family protein